jgi:hypothetical protein
VLQGSSLIQVPSEISVETLVLCLCIYIYIKFIKLRSLKSFVFKRKPKVCKLQIPQNLDLPCNKSSKETVKLELDSLKKKIMQNDTQSPSYDNCGIILVESSRILQAPSYEDYFLKVLQSRTLFSVRQLVFLIHLFICAYIIVWAISPLPLRQLFQI